MGYHTSFKGQFQLNKVLCPEHKAYLLRFSEIRHMALNEEQLRFIPDPLRMAVGLPLGKNGMYFTGMIEDEEHTSYIPEDALLGYSYGFPGSKFLAAQESEPVRFPSNFCQWIPDCTGMGIEWNNGDKFYGYVGWLRFLLEHFLIPWGYELTGSVSWQGEQGEHATIVVENHQVTKVAASDSLLPRQQSDHVDEEIHTYWMTVGAISEAARKTLLEADCPILDVCHEPPIVLVGLPYDINYYKRHGHDDLAIWSTEGIALHSKGLRFWRDFRGEKIEGYATLHPSWDGVVRTMLLLSGESVPGEDNMVLYQDGSSLF